MAFQAGLIAGGASRCERRWRLRAGLIYADRQADQQDKSDAGSGVHSFFNFISSVFDSRLAC